MQTLQLQHYVRSRTPRHLPQRLKMALADNCSTSCHAPCPQTSQLLSEVAVQELLLGLLQVMILNRCIHKKCHTCTFAV